MGSLLIARCTTCGYENSDLSYGVSMSEELNENMELPFYVPCYNKRSRKVSSKDIFSKARENKNIVFYSDDGACKNKIIHNRSPEERSFGPEINDTENYCPMCENFTLQFAFFASFD